MLRFSHKPGTSFARKISLTISGDPVDLTGATVRATARTAQGFFLERLTASVSDALNGEISVTASAEATADWPAVDASFDVKITFANGRVVSTPTYAFEVLPGMTRD